MLLSEAIRKGEMFDCPYCEDGCARRTLVGMIVHIRRDLAWGNYRIADWVAEQEKRLGITEPRDHEKNQT